VPLGRALAIALQISTILCTLHLMYNPHRPAWLSVSAVVSWIVLFEVTLATQTIPRAVSSKHPSYDRPTNLMSDSCPEVDRGGRAHHSARYYHARPDTIVFMDLRTCPDVMLTTLPAGWILHSSVPSHFASSLSFFLGTGIAVPPETNAPTPRITPSTPLIMKNWNSGLLPPV
jgi:hypothetical protein